MIRPLAQRCWYFDGDPWAQPHFASEVEALADETDQAEADERDLRPVLCTAAGCWVADCDRCERPQWADGDDDRDGAELHCDSHPRLSIELDAAGWRVVPDGLLCCPDCATARPAVAEVQRVAVTVRESESVRQTVGEATVCPQLAVTALRGEQEGRWWGLVLTRRPTGRYLPIHSWTTDVGVPHWVASCWPTWTGPHRTRPTTPPATPSSWSPRSTRRSTSTPRPRGPRLPRRRPPHPGRSVSGHGHDPQRLRRRRL